MRKLIATSAASLVLIAAVMHLLRNGALPQGASPQQDATLSRSPAGNRPFTQPVSSGRMTDSVWIIRHRAGGHQCSHAIADADLPDPAADLKAVGVATRLVGVDALAVCEACGCPSWAEIQYAWVSVADTLLAKDAGFETTARVPSQTRSVETRAEQD